MTADGMTAHQDATILALAATILRRRSRRPRGPWLDAQCRVLESAARAAEAEARANQRADARWAPGSGNVARPGATSP